MKLVLLSGGTGKRLWPLSNEVRSKQFLKMFRNANGELESMVQRIWRQLDENQMLNNVHISTSKKQVDLIQSQLGSNVQLIIEPESRDTFPAIALISTYFHSKLGLDHREVITVSPVDPYVEELFFTKLKQLEDVIHHSRAKIALIGVTPTYASTKYGYIVPGEATVDRKQHVIYQKVSSFKEKPCEQQAQKLIEQQALWNCGVFAFQLGYMIEELKNRGWPTEFDQMIEQFGNLPQTSFDYEVAEKVEKVVVVPYEGKWKDMGTWNTMTEEMNGTVVGKGYLGQDCINTHIINELDTPVVTIGTNDTVVAVSPDGILIADKTKSHLVKNIALDLERRPMFEERRWGWYQAFDYQKTVDLAEVMTKRLHIFAEKNLSYQYHRHRSEVWVIIAGEGEFILEDRLRHVCPGDVLEIPVGAKHTIKATKDLDIIEVQMGSKLEEEDIVRLSMSWEETMRRIKTE